MLGVAPIKSGGALHSDPQAKAELLNTQFQSVFTHEDPDSALPQPKDRPIPTIPQLDISAVGIEKLLGKLNENKATGTDCIPNQFLKNAAKPVSVILQHIFEQSLRTGELPEDWRDANISPIFKKDDRNLAVNYRPVSLTSVSCKLLEHIIVKHMLDHFHRYKVLTNRQHGCRAVLSCETQLLCTTFDLLHAYDSEERVDVGVLEFSKVFDTVPHHHLMSKLDHYGVQGPIQMDIKLPSRQDPASCSRGSKIIPCKGRVRCLTVHHTGTDIIPLFYQ